MSSGWVFSTNSNAVRIFVVDAGKRVDFAGLHPLDPLLMKSFEAFWREALERGADYGLTRQKSRGQRSRSREKYDFCHRFSNLRESTRLELTA